MSQRQPVRVPAVAVIGLGFWILACASGPSSSDSSYTYTPTPVEPAEPTAPAEPETPADSPDTPPDRPWVAPERTLLSHDLSAPSYPWAHFTKLQEEWESGGKLSTPTHTNPPMVVQGEKGSLYSGYVKRMVEDRVIKVAVGLAIVSKNPDFLSKGMWTSRSISHPGTWIWGYHDLDGMAHGPIYENWEPEPDAEPVTKAVGAYERDRKTGEWWECNEAGAVIAKGNYSNDRKTGQWRYFSDYGFLERLEDYLPGGAVLVQEFEEHGPDEDGDGMDGVLLKEVHTPRPGTGQTLVTVFGEDGWYCYTLPADGTKQVSGWWTYYDNTTRRRVRDVWRTEEGLAHGPWIEYDDAGNVKARHEYDNDQLVRPPQAEAELPSPTEGWHWRRVLQGKENHPTALLGCAVSPITSDAGWLIFGGSDSKTVTDETWLFKDNKWTRVEPQGDTRPPACTDATMVYLPATSSWLLFGGKSPAGEPLGGTWLFDGKSWRQLSETGPSARWGAAMTWHSATGRVVLYGGQDKLGPGDDTWEFKDGAWRQLSEAGTGPGKRTHAGLAEYPAASKVILYGGRQALALGAEDTTTWVLEDGTWMLANAATGPADHRPILTCGGHGLPMFLIANHFQSHAVFELRQGGETVDWKRVSEGWTLGGENRMFCADPSGTRVLAFGGSRRFPRTPALFETWELVKLSGKEAEEHAATFHAPGFRILNTSRHRDVVTNHLVVFDEARGKAVSFGGCHDMKRPGGLARPMYQGWEFDGTDWQKKYDLTSHDSITGRFLYFDTVRQKVMSVQTANMSGSEERVRVFQYEHSDKGCSLVSNTQEPKPARGVAFDSDRGVLVWIEKQNLTDENEAGDRRWIAWVLIDKTWSAEIWADGPESMHGAIIYYDRSRKATAILTRTAALDKRPEAKDVLYRWDGQSWQSETLSQRLTDVPLQTSAWVRDDKRDTTWLVGDTAVWRVTGTQVTAYRKPARLSSDQAVKGVEPSSLAGWADPETGKVFWIGGSAYGAPVNDTWEMDPDELEPLEDA